MATDKTDEAKIAEELNSIKRLLILALLNSGLSQSEIAGALQIDRSVISRMFSGGVLRKMKKKEK